MKQYTKNYENTTTDVNTGTKVLLSKAFREPSDHVAGSFRIGTLSHTHIITSEFVLCHDRILDIYYKEWQQWLDDYRIRQLNRPHSAPFTPTDFT